MFSESDETLCRTAVSHTAIDFDELLQQGFAHIPLPDAPFAEGGFATPSGNANSTTPPWRGWASTPCPTTCPITSRPAAYPLAMISPPARNFLNSSFANVASLPAWKSARCWRCTPMTPAARHCRR
jgi:hypothetical protein